MKFKRFYNALSAGPVLLGGISLVLMIKIIGTGNISDAYFMATSIIGLLNLIELHYVDQFLIFYTEEKQVSRESGASFYITSLLISSILSIILFYFIFYNINLLQLVFSNFLDLERTDYLNSIITILLPNIIVFPLNFINSKLLNAEGSFALPILFTWFPSSATCFCLVTSYNSPNMQNIVIEIATYQVIACWITTFIGIISCLFHIGYYDISKVNIKKVLHMIKNSFSMRLGHNIHNFIFPVILNNFLSYLSQGNISCYYYAQRMYQAVSSISFGPMMGVLQTRIASSWKENKIEIPEIQKEYIKNTIPLYFILVIFIYFSAIIVMDNMNNPYLNHNLIGNLFIGISLWGSIVAYENIFVSISLAAKDSVIFILVNLLFITIFSLTTFSLINKLSALAIPISAIIAQLISLYFYRNRSIINIHND